MVREISSMRITKSFVSPTGASNVVSRELDYQLGPRMGLSLLGVSGWFGEWDDSSLENTSDTIGTLMGMQSLHIETGTLETVPWEGGDDEDVIDSEILYIQTSVLTFVNDSTTEFRASQSRETLPSGLVTFPRPVLTARNITHRGESFIAGQSASMGVLIYYVYVEFTLAEMGLLLARRS